MLPGQVKMTLSLNKCVPESASQKSNESII